ncbi:MAG: AmmeMemoRadiSam system protein B [Azonexus sp.]|nr:AmmeMemoRadiSam system protein B [Betaproteobacteria bacterium]MBK8917886.1 AmmeMemoRadiSam system protein B [Betaproteobacteria bacterium]MBP6037547.1 AmmeMemoRadiSam system protein B [Azonexus sp.]MBP6908120.1 AmmeMemoRadiSam system protein B [Azonexus sp.]
MVPGTIRPPAVAGAFYPAEPSRLRAEVEGFLASPPVSGPWPKALIVPHAGYVYSGAVAASAYRLLRSGGRRIRRVVLLGPCHRVALAGLAVPSTTSFATPLGAVCVDHEALAAVADLPQVVVSDAAHRAEHSLEVQLPFLQAVLGDFSLAPFAVGSASPQAVAEVLQRLWGGPETLIVVSSDLSHYHPYREAREIDGASCRRILAGGTDLGPQEACGAHALNGLLLAAGCHGLGISLLDCRNSGDTAGDRDRVVGYAAFALQADHEALPA